MNAEQITHRRRLGNLVEAADNQLQAVREARDEARCVLGGETGGGPTPEQIATHLVRRGWELTELRESSFKARDPQGRCTLVAGESVGYGGTSLDELLVDLKVDTNEEFRAIYCFGIPTPEEALDFLAEHATMDADSNIERNVIASTGEVREGF